MSQTRESHPESMRKLGALVATGCVLMAAALPALAVYQWAFASAVDLARDRASPVAAAILAPTGDLTMLQRLIGATGNLLPALILSWGLLNARAALNAISDGRFFSPEVVKGLKGYACAAFWSAVVDFLMEPVLSVGLTFANPPGFRVLTVGLSSNDLFAVLGAGIVWIIVAALASGAALAHENEQFV